VRLLSPCPSGGKAHDTRRQAGRRQRTAHQPRHHPAIDALPEHAPHLPSAHRRHPRSGAPALTGGISLLETRATVKTQAVS